MYWSIRIELHIAYFGCHDSIYLLTRCPKTRKKRRKRRRGGKTLKTEWLKFSCSRFFYYYYICRLEFFRTSPTVIGQIKLVLMWHTRAVHPIMVKVLTVIHQWCQCRQSPNKRTGIYSGLIVNIGLSQSMGTRMLMSSKWAEATK